MDVQVVCLCDVVLCCYDLVGLICEIGDFFVKDCDLVFVEGDFLVVCLVGVYGFVMSLNYNICGCVVEVLVDGEQIYEVCCCEIV